MPAVIKERSNPKSSGTTSGTFERRPSVFLRMRDGVNYIWRIRPIEYTQDGNPVLGADFYRYWIHTARKQGGKQESSVIAEYDNPISRKMTELGLSKDDEGFKKREKRFYINVLDRTLVKRATSGMVYYPTGYNSRREPIFPERDDSGKEDLTTIPALPRNEVLVVECGPMLWNELLKWDGNAVNNKTGDAAELCDIDFAIKRTSESRGAGAPPKVAFTVIPHFDHDPLPEELENIPVYDVVKMSEPLPNDLVEATVYGDMDFYEAIREAAERKGQKEPPRFEAPKRTTEDVPF